jgi:hypothetical protein
MTYEHVVVSIKATGPDPLVHIPVEVAWWDLSTGDRGRFIPPHDPRQALAACDLETVDLIDYIPRLANGRQDTDGHEARRLADVLSGAVLVTITPNSDEHLLRRMYLHYLNNFEVHQALTLPVWQQVLDIGAYAAGVLGLSGVPDIGTICRATGTPLEAVQTAETDVDALGRATLRLHELAAAAKHRQHPVATVPACEELADALAARIDRDHYDLITFHDDDEYNLRSDVIGTMATEVYGPAIVSLRGQLDDLVRQMTEMATATTAAANQYQQRLTEQRTLPLAPEMHAVIKASVDAAQDGEAAANAVVEMVRGWTAAQQSIINGLCERVEALDRELAGIQASRQDRALAVLDTELSAATPWTEPVIAPTELSVGPDTREPAMPPEREVVAVGPITAADLVAIAQFVSPLTGGCPNTPPGCGHPGFAHDIEDFGDPLPTCGASEGDTDCRCGHAPTGFRRVIPMRVWRPGEAVPAEVFAYGGDGDAVLYETEDWVNDTGSALVELVAVVPRDEPVRDGEPDSIAQTAPAAEVAS